MLRNIGLDDNNDLCLNYQINITCILLSVIEKGDNKEIFVIGGFMRKKCKLLFDLLKL